MQQCIFLGMILWVKYVNQDLYSGIQYLVKTNITMLIIWKQKFKKLKFFN